MTIWHETTLGQLLKIEHGFAFKSKYFSEAGEFVVLTPGNFHESGGFRARPGKDRFYRGKFPSKYLLAKNDLIVAMTEQGEGLLGSAALIPDENRYLHNQRLGRVSVKPGNDKRFVYYLFNTDFIRRQIRNSSSGAKVRHTSPERIYQIKALVPEKSCQQKIAAILCSYDDLIENNNRKIGLLEKLAEEIYREWFVRFRFPGYQKTDLEDGVPTGWNRAKLLTLSNYLGRGVAPKYDDLAPGIAVNQKCIRNGKLDLSFARHQSKEIFLDKYIKFGDVLINSTGEGTLGRVAQVLISVTNCIADSHVTIVRPKSNISIYYFGMTLKAWEPQFSTMGQGSTNQTELSPSAIGNIEMTLPAKHVQTAFELNVDPLFKQITELMNQNRCLSTSRDMLLPRLMSGKLSVEDLDIQYPPSMAEELEAQQSSAVYA
jgi:type I restriction enzyme S subunit